MSIKRQVWVAAVGVFTVTGAMLSFAVTEQEQQIIDRIKPVGEVCIQGKSDCAAPVAAVASGPRSGADVYGTACVACHGTGVAGAPKLGGAADWTRKSSWPSSTWSPAASKALPIRLSGGWLAAGLRGFRPSAWLLAQIIPFPLEIFSTFAYK